MLKCSTIYSCLGLSLIKKQHHPSAGSSLELAFGLILEWTYVCDVVVNVVFLFSDVFNPILRIDLNLFTLSPLGWSLLLFSVFVLVSVSSNVWCHFIICLCKEQGTKMLIEEARGGGGVGGGGWGGWSCGQPTGGPQCE